MNGRIIVLILALSAGPCLQSQSFKERQLRHPRVQRAALEKQTLIDSVLKAQDIRKDSFRLFIRGLKHERLLELWGAAGQHRPYRLLRTYPFCALSGGLGPKRREGDGQIPEGVYSINRFNPNSKFHLSLGINYPNRSDAVLGMRGALGGEIFIHGDCVTIGCIPLTDDKIKEVYLFAVEARTAGQAEIPVHLFPFRMDSSTLTAMMERQNADERLTAFWNNLAPVYRHFDSTHRLVPVRVDSAGWYHLLH